MLILKYVLTTMGALLVLGALVLTSYELWLLFEYRRAVSKGKEGAVEPAPVRWRMAGTWLATACLLLLSASSITIVPSGMGGVRVSQTRGTLAGTLYSGVHFVTPLTERVEVFDLRDKLFTTGMAEADRKPAPGMRQESLDVQSREGLSLGMAITVRYRLDPRRLDYIQSHLPQPVETEIVPPVVASAWRELAPGYTVREIFSAKREEVRQRASEIMTRKLAADGIVVEEVMLRDIRLPEEYAKGLQQLLLKEQEDDQLSIQTDIQQKQVRIAELEAQAEEAQKVTGAEGDAKAKVMEAKGEADAMQYTLPLKEKQIQQSKLEAEARKEATIQNAQAEAEAKVIDSKAELQRRNLFADAEANRIRVTAAADSERMQSEAKVLNQSPLLINKIIAERLSDKIQVMMVPADGKFFFANDVFKGTGANAAIKQEMESQDAQAGQSH